MRLKAILAVTSWAHRVWAQQAQPHAATDHSVSPAIINILCNEVGLPPIVVSPCFLMLPPLAFQMLPRSVLVPSLILCCSQGALGLHLAGRSDAQFGKRDLSDYIENTRFTPADSSGLFISVSVADTAVPVQIDLNGYASFFAE